MSERLRSMSQARLATACGPYPSAADAGRAVAQTLADAAAVAEGEQPRPLPRLSDFAVGDQVAVTGHDLIAALGGGVPADAGRATLAAEVARVRRLL